MNCSIFLFSTVVTSGALSHDLPDANTHRCESLLLRAIKSDNEFEQRNLVLDCFGQFSRSRGTMSRSDKRQVAFLAGVLLQTATSWDSRLCTVAIFRRFHDVDALPAFTAIAALLPEIEEWERDLDRRPGIAEPTQRASGGIKAILAAFERNWPSIRLNDQPKQPATTNAPPKGPK